MDKKATIAQRSQTGKYSLRRETVRILTANQLVLVAAGVCQTPSNTTQRKTEDEPGNC